MDFCLGSSFRVALPQLFLPPSTTMEVTTHPEPTRELDHVLPSDDEDLSEDQIQALLKQAEVSLRDKAASAHQVQSFSAFNFKLPKLDAGEIATPYIQTNGEVARVNSAKLLDSQQRDLANQQTRKVEDPVAVRKKQIEVRSTLLLALPMRKTFPNFLP